MFSHFLKYTLALDMYLICIRDNNYVSALFYFPAFTSKMALNFASL